MLLFIYGTLKKGMSNHSVLERTDAEFYLEVQTFMEYPMYASGQNFPYLQDTPGIGHKIKGELWVVPEKDIRMLDSFEGVPDLYTRGVIAVTDGRIVTSVEGYFVANELTREDLLKVTLLTNWEE